MSEQAQPQKDPRDVTNTIEEHWEDFARRVYKEGMSDRQNFEVGRAFFAGAFVMMIKMQIISERLEEDAACKRIDELDRELRALLLPNPTEN